jgi:hypothetical protein
MQELQAAGAASLRAIARGLNERNIPTARGACKQSAVQVMWVMAGANLPAVVAASDKRDRWVDTVE